MPAVGPRVLLLDVPIALAIGVASWFSAQASRWFDRADGARLEGHGGGWRGGPPSWPQEMDGLPEVWWWPLPIVLIMAGGLAVRRLFPRVGFGVVVLAVGAFLAIGGPYGPCLLAPALAVYSLSVALPFERWAPLTVILIPMLTAGFWSEPFLGLLDPRAYGAVIFGLGAILLPAMIGLLRRNRREADQTARTEELRRHAYEERLRVAREVHDVVGHSLSVINLQAGVALHVLNRRPERVEGALAAIKTTSKEALDELRSTLEVFRDPDLRLGPGAGLARLDDLVASLRAAGRDVTVDDQRSQPLPVAVDQAAFRIVQESLTNVVRHTDAAARVTLRTESAREERQRSDHQPLRRAVSLVIMVVDDGAASGPLIEGNGITGMRERARAVGGQLSVMPGPAGVTVRADLPLTVEASG
jgi:signal transduction histidine kinase